MKDYIFKNKILAWLFVAFFVASVVVLILYFADSLKGLSDASQKLYNENAKPFLDGIMIVFHEYFVAVPLLTILVIVEFVAQYKYKKKFVKTSFLFLSAFVVAGVFTFVSKQLLAKQRPFTSDKYPEFNSFPSGHTLITTVLFLTLAILLFKNRKTILAILCVLVPMLVGLCRVVQGEHFIDDTVAGFVWGTTIALGSNILFFGLRPLFLKYENFCQFVYGSE